MRIYSRNMTVWATFGGDHDIGIIILISLTFLH